MRPRRKSTKKKAQEASKTPRNGDESDDGSQSSRPTPNTEQATPNLNRASWRKELNKSFNNFDKFKKHLSSAKKRGSDFTSGSNCNGIIASTSSGVQKQKSGSSSSESQMRHQKIEKDLLKQNESQLSTVKTVPVPSIDNTVIPSTTLPVLPHSSNSSIQNNSNQVENDNHLLSQNMVLNSTNNKLPGQIVFELERPKYMPSDCPVPILLLPPPGGEAISDDRSSFDFDLLEPPLFDNLLSFFHSDTTESANAIRLLLSITPIVDLFTQEFVSRPDIVQLLRSSAWRMGMGLDLKTFLQSGKTMPKPNVIDSDENDHCVGKRQRLDDGNMDESIASASSSISLESNTINQAESVATIDTQFLPSKYSESTLPEVQSRNLELPSISFQKQPIVLLNRPESQCILPPDMNLASTSNANPVDSNKIVHPGPGHILVPLTSCRNEPSSTARVVENNFLHVTAAPASVSSDVSPNLPDEIPPNNQNSFANLNTGEAPPATAAYDQFSTASAESAQSIQNGQNLPHSSKLTTQSESESRVKVPIASDSSATATRAMPRYKKIQRRQPTTRSTRPGKEAEKKMKLLVESFLSPLNAPQSEDLLQTIQIDFPGSQK